jgi:hypothetical protein
MNRAIAVIVERLTPSLSIDVNPIKVADALRDVNRTRRRLGETVAGAVIFGFAPPLSNDIVFICGVP